MTLLRKKMIRELELQRKASGTVSSYVRSVAELAKFHSKSPGLLGVEEVRDFVHYLIVAKKLWIGTVNQMLAGIKFLYGQVLDREIDLKIATKKTGKLPEPLSREAIARLLDVAPRCAYWCKARPQVWLSATTPVFEWCEPFPCSSHSHELLLQRYVL